MSSKPSKRGARPGAPLSLGAAHRRSLTAAAVLSMLGVLSDSRILQVSGGLMIALMLAVGARRLHRIERTRTELVLVHGATVAVLAFAIATFKTQQIDSVMNVLMLGVFNRYMLRAGHRDDFLVIAAAGVLLSAATTVTPGMEFALLVLLAVPNLIWALWTSMLLGAAAPAERARVADEPLPAGRGRLAFSGLGLGLVFALAVSALPRYKFMSHMLGAGALAALPAASNRMEVTNDGVPERQDGTIVLRVEPASGDPASVDGLYARLYVLDRFDGRTWSASSGGHFGAKYPKMPGEEEAAWVRIVQEREVMLDLHHPVAAVGRERPSLPLERDVHEDASGNWVRDRAVVQRSRTLELHAALDVPFAKGALRAEHFAKKLDEDTRALPEGLDPRVRPLAERLTRSADTPKEKIAAVLGHFRRGYAYSTEPLEGTSEDPLARFLFEAKRGHCELYASAVAVLLRAAGLKARIATGYYGGRWSELGGYQLFTRTDAHSWVEVHDGDAWRWVDATPEDLRRPESLGLTAWLRDGYDAIDAAWYDSVVDFDSARQRALYERIGSELVSGAFATGLFDSGEEGASRRGAVGAALGVVVALALAAVGGLVTLRRRRDPRWLGERLRRALGETGGPEKTLGMLLAELGGPARNLAAHVVGDYERLRFGGGGEELRRAVERGVRHLERELRHQRAAERRR